MLSQDSFYRGLTKSELANVSNYDFDSPQALDQAAIVTCLKDLKVCNLTPGTQLIYIGYLTSVDF